MKLRERFKVHTAAEFLNNGPAFGSAEYRESIQQEKTRKLERLARQQQKIDEWQVRKAQMTEREILMDEISMLNDIKQNSMENLARVNAEFQKLMNGEEK